MSLFEQHTPEDNDAERLAWRKSFEEASEMPPARVWDAIERRLDEEESGIVPLWGSMPAAGAGSTAGGLVQGGTRLLGPWVRWVGTAAAALVVLTVGWWALQPKSGEDTIPVVADRSEPHQPVPKESKQSPALTDTGMALARIGQSGNSPVVSEGGKSSVGTGLKGGNKATSFDGAPLALTEKHKPTATGQSSANRILTPSEDLTVRSLNNGQKVVGLMSQPNKAANPVLLPKPNGESLPTIAGRESEPVTPIAGNATAVPDQRPKVVSGNEMTLVSFSEIQPKEVGQLQTNLHETQRVVWFRALEADPVDVESNKPSSQREVWASASVVPSSFNPAVALQSVPTGAVYANYGSTSRASATELVNSQANLSVAYQLATGLQLGNRWSVETGIGYLQARSTVDSPAQTIIPSMVSSAITTGKVSSLYADVLRSSSATLALADKNTQSYITGAVLYDAAQMQVISNTYQFVQMPVQIGYQVLPRKRLGISLLGGLLTNWFVRNKVADDLTITTQDGVYRPVTFSATTGLRLRYRSTQHWSASLAGMYQHALQNGTHSSVGVQIHPKTIGVSMGVDYHF